MLHVHVSSTVNHASNFSGPGTLQVTIGEHVRSENNANKQDIEVIVSLNRTPGSAIFGGPLSIFTL